MRIISRSTLVAYWEKHPETKAPLSHWLQMTKAATWTDPQTVLADFSKAKTLNGERVRFEIAGGDYRLIVAFDFPRQAAFIKFIGSHAEYDRVDALTVSRSRRLDMEIRPIRTDADHEAAVQDIEALWGAEAGTPQGDRLDVMITLVDAYEDKRWPVAAADPVEAIKNSMAMEGRSQSDLADLLGSPSRASEVLHRKRSLTLPMIRALHDNWRIPAEMLVQPYETAA